MHPTEHIQMLKNLIKQNEQSLADLKGAVDSLEKCRNASMERHLQGQETAPNASVNSILSQGNASRAENAVPQDHSSN